MATKRTLLSLWLACATMVHVQSSTYHLEIHGILLWCLTTNMLKRFHYWANDLTIEHPIPSLSLAITIALEVCASFK